MRHWNFLAVLMVGLMGFAGHVFAQTPPPVDAYAANTAISSVDISPNGQRLAMLASVEGNERRAIVTDIGGEGATVLSLTDEVDVSPTGINWLNDEYLLVSFVQRRRPPGGGPFRNIPRLYIMRADGGHTYQMNLAMQIVSILPEEPNFMLVTIPFVRDDRFTARGRSGNEDGISAPRSLFRHNIRRNSQQRVEIGEPDTQRMLVNEAREPVLRYDFDDENRQVEIFVNDGRWRSVYQEEYRTEYFGRGNRAPRIWVRAGNPVALVDGGPTYWSMGYDEDWNMIVPFQFDPLTGEQIDIGIDTDGVDFGRYLTDWRTGHVIGAFWASDVSVYHYFDDPWRTLQSQLEAQFPGSSVSMTSWDMSGTKIIVARTIGGSSGAYYLFDTEAGSLSLIGRIRPGIPDEWIADVIPVEYQSRDGTTIPAYVTLPPNRDLANLPLVVLPHGGPEARDYYGFDEWAQLIASRGYVVIQPQFRGSDGYGRDYIRAGHGEWGRAMQDDLTDSIAYLAGQGIVDEDRVCIFGWSYGGYAALAGATLTPELYRCVIAGAPVTEVLEMMDWASDTNGLGAVNYWTEYIGDWRRQRDEMIAISPYHQVNNAQAPILLVHGTDDTIVPIEQAEMMAEALEEAGKTYEFMTLEDGPHVSVLMTREHKQEFYTRLLDFLERHNPAD